MPTCGVWSMAELKLEQFEHHEESSVWSTFLDQAEASIFQRPSFLAYHGEEKFPAEQFQPHHIGVMRKGKPVAFLPATRVLRDDGTWQLRSPFASSHGGFVWAPKISISAMEEVIGSVLEAGRSVADSMTIGVLPSCYDAMERSGASAWLLRAAGGVCVASDLLLGVPVSPAAAAEEDALLAGLPTKERTAWRRARKGAFTVRVEEGCSAEAHAVLAAAWSRFEQPLTHSLDDLQRIERCCPGTIRTVVVEGDAGCVAGVVLFRVNGVGVNSFYIFDDGAHRRDGVALLGAVEAIAETARWGCRWLDYGASNFGTTPHHTLIHFKESLGGRAVERQTFAFS